MRAEDAGARTWLYAALAGWALCVWVLAMFGMGGSIERLDDDASLLQPLPDPPAPAPERLGPLPQYGDIAARPLFTEDRRPQPFVIDPMADAGGGGGFDYVLTSVLRTPAVQLVILQPAGGGEPVRVRQGNAPDGAPGWVLQSVEPRRAVFAGPEGEMALELRVFDGVGGQAPTPPSRPDAMVGPADPMSGPTDPMTGPASAATVTADPGMSLPDDAPGSDGATSDGPMADVAANDASRQQAAQEQVEMIRRRIEERRARLRADERATRPPAGPSNQ